MRSDGHALGRAAKYVARMMTPHEMMNGGIQNGVHVDPVTLLLGSLHVRFSALGEESRVTSMTEMLAFTRLPGEHINALLARYEAVRQRAAAEDQFAMSIEGCALQLLRACGVNHHQYFNLLQPFQGQLPQTEVQFTQMCSQLRRYGHVAENAPGNVAASLHGPMRQARPGAYLAEEQFALRDVAQRSSGSAGLASFFGSIQDSAQTGLWDDAYWSDAQPQPGYLSIAGGGHSAEPWHAPYGGGHSAEPWSPRCQEAAAFPVYPGPEDSPASTATSSDDGEEVLDFPDFPV